MPDELKSAIDEAAKDSGVSVAWWMRQTAYIRLKSEGVQVDNVHPQHLGKTGGKNEE